MNWIIFGKNLNLNQPIECCFSWICTKEKFWCCDSLQKEQHYSYRVLKFNDSNLTQINIKYSLSIYFCFDQTKLKSGKTRVLEGGGANMYVVRAAWKVFRKNSKIMSGPNEWITNQSPCILNEIQNVNFWFWYSPKFTFSFIYEKVKRLL